MGEQSAEGGVRRRPKDRKQQILAHARDLFVELGYHNVTMGTIASRVGIAPSALYRHFANKAVLLEAVIEDSFGDIAFPEGDVSLELVLVDASALAVARPLGVLWSREARHLPEESQAALRDTLRQSAQGYVRLLQRDRPDLPAAHAELLAWGIQSVMASPSYRTVRISGSDHADALIRAGRAIAALPLGSGSGTGEGPAVGKTGLSPVSRRERLLLAANRLFAERGYHETSLDDIGAKADVTGPNLYGYFDNKAAVLKAVLERGTHSLWLDLEEALSKTEDPHEALVAVANAYVSRFAARPRLGRQLTGEPEIEQLAAGYQREYVAEWVALLQAARPELDRKTARLLVHIAMAVADDVIATRHLHTVAGFSAYLTAMIMAVLES
ncbi:TetR/AcrR family transcriptional regulator [Saccharopolyspora elongata]|uniref:TetR/AcrR family transcriptional regulator n=1 Tax=Saccharopolyspora elongata TaxID=2530387 RepID=A0A4R4XSN3_9PSEU|nr:TetR/AcrR family transcriptional regulator [Saccharopolyspora elongata]TDD34210.1 TetR/AcrR family transcriptional regulator [Saccharopolyspora elongata]